MKRPGVFRSWRELAGFLAIAAALWALVACVAAGVRGCR